MTDAQTELARRRQVVTDTIQAVCDLQTMLLELLRDLQEQDAEATTADAKEGESESPAETGASPVDRMDADGRIEEAADVTENQVRDYIDSSTLWLSGSHLPSPMCSLSKPDYVFMVGAIGLFLQRHGQATPYELSKVADVTENQVRDYINSAAHLSFGPEGRWVRRGSQ